MYCRTCLSVAALVAVAGLGFVAGRMEVSAERARALEAALSAEQAFLELASVSQPEENAEFNEMMEAWANIGQPGEHHEHLDTLVGEWDATWQMWMEPGAEPMEMTGTISREWILDGRFVKEDVQSSTPMGPFQGIGVYGYDKIDGAYKTLWMDSMSTNIYSEMGQYDPEKKILRLQGHMHDPTTNTLAFSRGEVDMSKPDHHVYTGYKIGADGKEFKAFTGDMKRRN
ncbi:MAG: DUF1579 family protein [Phycisphaerales bacterium]